MVANNHLSSRVYILNVYNLLDCASVTSQRWSVVFFPFSLVYLLYLANLVYLTAGEAKISLTLSLYEKKRFSLMLIQYRNEL